jgi:hypothetical protein
MICTRFYLPVGFAERYQLQYKIVLKVFTRKCKRGSQKVSGITLQKENET